MPIVGCWTLIVTGPVFGEQVTDSLVACAYGSSRLSARTCLTLCPFSAPNAYGTAPSFLVADAQQPFMGLFTCGWSDILVNVSDLAFSALGGGSLRISQ